MITITRRSLLASLAASAAYPLAAEPQQFTPGARRQAIDNLMAYLHTTAPQLLRPAEGILKHPSIAPTLPGKEYSTSLWDWDTLWTTRGLFRFVALANDHDLRNHPDTGAPLSHKGFMDWNLLVLEMI